jgi:hypothetical protein
MNQLAEVRDTLGLADEVVLTAASLVISVETVKSPDSRTPLFLLMDPKVHSPKRTIKRPAIRSLEKYKV